LRTVGAVRRVEMTLRMAIEALWMDEIHELGEVIAL
jgi:hypothetical protein